MLWKRSVYLLLGLLLALPAVAQNNAGTNPPLAGPGPYFGPYAQAQALVQFAHVTGSKGVTSTTHPTTGVYCFRLASGVVLKTAPVVSIEWGSSLGVVLFAQWNADNTTCGAGANILEIRTYKGDSGGVGSSYQIPVLSDQVAFVVLVP